MVGDDDLLLLLYFAARRGRGGYDCQGAEQRRKLSSSWSCMLGRIETDCCWLAFDPTRAKDDEQPRFWQLSESNTSQQQIIISIPLLAGSREQAEVLMTSGNAIVAGPSSRPIPSRYCNLPDPARLARLSLSSSIDKHVASLQGLPDDYSPSAAAISPQIASALAVSFVRHLLFARGLTSTTIGQLEKERQREQQLDTGAVRGPKTQRRKRRDQVSCCLMGQAID